MHIQSREIFKYNCGIIQISHLDRIIQWGGMSRNLLRVSDKEFSNLAADSMVWRKRLWEYLTHPQLHPELKILSVWFLAIYL